MAGDKQGKLTISPVIIAAIVTVLAVLAVLIWSYYNPALPNSVELKVTGNETISGERLSTIGSILQERFKAGGYRVAIEPYSENASLVLRYDKIPYDDLRSIATAQGVFEMRIQTGDNQSDLILYGDDVQDVGIPTPFKYLNGTADWDVIIQLSPSGAEKFKQACIDSGATKDTASHPVIMLLDNKKIYSRPISAELAGEISTRLFNSLSARIGTGDEGKAMADKLYVCLKGGALPCTIEVGNTSSG